jgi:light-regulated signal transduction histidine kinase (bacteriophytochrome)
VGVPIERLVPERFSERHVKHRAKYAREPKARPMGAGIDLLARRADGSEFPVEISLSPLRTDRGLLVMAAVRDITRRREDAMRLEEYARRLRRSNQELETFAHVASHDLKEPLRTISGFLQLLQKRQAGKLDEESEQYVTYVLEAASRMREMLNDLLLYSAAGTQELNLEPVDLGESLARVRRSLGSLLQERGAVVQSGRLPDVMGDPHQLDQVLQNLVANGVKFNTSSTPKVRLDAERTPEGWHVVVADNGIGIPARRVQEVFEPFRRLHPRDTYEGSGLGLALCKKIVERHGGRIWLESEERKGTRVHLVLADEPRPVA